MITVTVGNNLSRTSNIVDPAITTPRMILDGAHIDYSMANVHMDGESLGAANMDKSFEELGVTKQCYLIAVTKTNNA